MHDCIASWFGWLRAWFAPREPGRHSGAYLTACAVPAGPVAPVPVAALRQASRRPVRVPVAGEPWWVDNGDPVRPYVRLYEEERRAQQERRRALVSAAVGIDVGPRVIHGVEVGR